MPINSHSHSFTQQFARCSFTSIPRATISHGFPRVYYLMAPIETMFKSQIQHGDIAFESFIRIKVDPKSHYGWLLLLWYHKAIHLASFFHTITSSGREYTSLSLEFYIPDFPSPAGNLLFWISIYNLICVSPRGENLTKFEESALSFYQGLPMKTILRIHPWNWWPISP